MKKKTICKILIILSLAIFLMPLLSSIFAALKGVTKPCANKTNCIIYYKGIKAFKDTIIRYFNLFWPSYIIALILIIISILMLRKIKD